METKKRYFAPFDLLVVIVVVLGLLVGLLVLGSRSWGLKWKGVALSVPASLQGRVKSTDRSLTVRAPFSRSPYFVDRVRLQRIKLNTGVTNRVDPVHALRRNRYKRYRLYREIDGGRTRRQGTDWVQFEYAYVIDPDTGSPGQDARPPVVVQGIARMYRRKGSDQLYLLTYDCDSLDYRANLSRAIAVFDSLVYR